jgi:hypothetical protein
MQGSSITFRWSLAMLFGSPQNAAMNRLFLQRR